MRVTRTKIASRNCGNPGRVHPLIKFLKICCIPKIPGALKRRLHGGQESSEDGAATETKLASTLRKIGLPSAAVAALVVLFSPCHPSLTSVGIPAGIVYTLLNPDKYQVDGLEKLNTRPEGLKTQTLSPAQIRKLFKAHPGLESVRQAKAKSTGLKEVPISRGQIDLDGDGKPEDVVVICPRELDTNGDGWNDTVCPCARKELAAYVIPGKGTTK